VGTYHTALPQYAQYLTEDAAVADLVWTYIVWYYDQMQFVYVPSTSTAEELADKGINRDKIRLFPRGVDTEFFHPSKRNGWLETFCPKENGWKLLYVGRISKEKNLPLLVNVFRSLLQVRENVNLILVGDGPYREEMERELHGTPTVFTGYLEGEKLASVFASSDLFLFPSTTDTFGNVVLEAQASGLPVIVTDCGGPQENLISGETGLVAKGNDEGSLLKAIQRMLDGPDRMAEMGRAARAYAEGRSFEKAYEHTWNLYREIGPAEQHEPPSIPIPFPGNEDVA
jgi:glycosyltransferase involved in cell wall biosynthesis